MTSFSVDLDALESAAAGINSTINELRSHSVNQLEVTVAQSGHREFTDNVAAVNTVTGMLEGTADPAAKR